MSSRHEEVMEALDVIFNGGKKERLEPPTQTEGFESLICEEEFKAIVALKESLENFIKVHNKCAVEYIEKFEKASPYARVQLMMLGDITNDAQRDIGAMYYIHEMNKERLESMLEDFGGSIESFEEHLRLKKLIDTVDTIFKS